MSVETSPEATPTDLASELGTAIADLPEYRAFVEAKEAVEASEAAQERIREFEQIREEFLVARQTGEATNEDVRTLQQAQESLHEVPVMDDFLRAQAALEERLAAINDAISDPLLVDFGEKAGSCCQE